ncbi:cytochrome P450 6k1-like isoform X2 [Nymphalis io]|uniref:cytochrome P450 6k1-like isoform X2 n=1 Tax=Inachis io TaxID=171585 RepID=UPI002169B9D9|nr:cytochrome P450 6k1-like isoform X2 [Nymphalis io]
MNLPLLFGAGLCFIFWLYIKWLKIKRYWADRGVPHLTPVPVLGNLTFIQRENAGLWFRRMNQQLKSPYIGIWILWRPGIVINSSEIARDILIKNFGNFRNRFLSSGETDPIGGLNLFTVNDPIWSTMRKHLSGVFTTSKLRILEDLMQTKAKELVQRIHNDRDIKIHLKKMYIDYTTDIIGSSAFGVKSDATLTGVGPLRDVTNDFATFTLYRGISWFSIFFFPEITNFFRFKLFPTAATRYFKEIFNSVKRQRKTNQGDAKDLLEILIKIQQENEGYSDDLIIAQAAIFLQGGFETSGTALMFITYELAYNPILQDKLYQELFEAAQQNESENFDTNILSNLTFLNCVIKGKIYLSNTTTGYQWPLVKIGSNSEGLRKYPTMGWLDRIATKDYKIDEKLTIESGTVVYINSIGMHYDPKYFPEPHRFDPDRFLPENKSKIEPYSYLPFGDGPRGCIGKRFAFMTMQFALASVVHNYNIKPCPNMPNPADIKMDKCGLLLLPGETLNVEFIPRK